jgi:DNA-binding response OmpR family regulator
MSGKKRILIIEDDESTRNLEKDILEEEGFEVEVARDGV